jgi:hypothetical protein
MTNFRQIGENIQSDFENHDSAGGKELTDILYNVYHRTTDPSGVFGELLIGLGVIKDHES